MRTTINIDDNLINELFIYYNAKTKTEAVNKALQDISRQLKKQRLIDLKGKIDIIDNFEQLKKSEISELKDE